MGQDENDTGFEGFGGSGVNPFDLFSTFFGGRAPRGGAEEEGDEMPGGFPFGQQHQSSGPGHYTFSSFPGGFGGPGGFSSFGGGSGSGSGPKFTYKFGH